MRAIVVQQPGSIELVHRPEPAAPEPGWVAIDITHVGICGTDYHIFEGKHPYLNYPRVIGHELSGVVAADAAGWQKGARIIVNPYIACGQCHACLRGKPNCCMQIGVLGVHRDGGLCERINVPAQNLIAADGLEQAEAATVEFLAIGAHAVRRSGIGAADRALVVGAGPIGLGAALFARLRGAEVHLLDASAERLAMVADRFGFDGIHTVAEGPEALMQATQGDGFDVVFDATGSVRAMQASFRYVAHGGTMVLVGVVPDDIIFNDAEFHKREMSLLGSRNATSEDFSAVVSALASGAIDYRKLITHTTTLEGLPESIAAWAADRSQVIKAMVSVAG
ncbi:zinc-binding alcohol dehydrogenase family protein [Kaistia dalseonensis]|uniref:2-desacetyl-2-hydroxyethyl bacteriochlorophyllide A dehydrogenase n=1 Tax=Kaistia dalseonensis TaxID=410840 RepID=A0ABU0H750_9HYPH|nr:zinc-binding alcohol dehydrogenase family protein [Kaistia dalseonensis]MCX5494758.1 zinc-binding alcohol dehydrogenase family protein [Kaistia dalseonensis]MDQ0437339.1 2-desacetyl-2-hydroxyethyl bacteriochlorophyllide A dehydrogenase [Kaistia dalseonensis]